MIQEYLSAATCIIPVPANANQLSSFSTSQVLTERYFQTDQNIIYTKNVTEEVDLGLVKHPGQIPLLLQWNT